MDLPPGAGFKKNYYFESIPVVAGSLAVRLRDGGDFD